MIAPHLSESTIKLHIHHIIGKMGLNNRTEAAVAYHTAASNGFIDQVIE
ncbi:MAG: DNA-binding NarL/FixJ family response regulator [Halocynthiibacter sp.]|jgi:DNA-binding NarL/FixJ family response regulator